MALKIPKINKRKLTLVTLTLLAVFGLAALTGAVVQDYQDKRNTNIKQRQAEIQAAYDKGYAKGTSDRQTYLAKYELAMAECRKGKNAYNLLSNAQKTTLTRNNLAVNCDQPILQP